MNRVDQLRKEIEKAESVLAESQENYKNNPENYSARLLLMSTENYLSDLIRELDIELLKSGEIPPPGNG